MLRVVWFAFGPRGGVVGGSGEATALVGYVRVLFPPSTVCMEERKQMMMAYSRLHAHIHYNTLSRRRIAEFSGADNLDESSMGPLMGVF